MKIRNKYFYYKIIYKYKINKIFYKQTKIYLFKAYIIIILSLHFHYSHYNSSKIEFIKAFF